MKKKAIQKNKAAKVIKRPAVRTRIRKKIATRKRNPLRKAAVEPEKIISNADALGSLPEVINADRETTLDVIEVFEIGVLNTEGGLPSAEQAGVVPEETEEEVA
jgi:hypothetical protein